MHYTYQSAFQFYPRREYESHYPHRLIAWSVNVVIDEVWGRSNVRCRSSVWCRSSVQRWSSPMSIKSGVGELLLIKPVSVKSVSVILVRPHQMAMTRISRIIFIVRLKPKVTFFLFLIFWHTQCNIQKWKGSSYQSMV